MNSNQFKIQLFDLQSVNKRTLSKALSLGNILGLSTFVNSKAAFKRAK
jgi:hypothetical protein